MPLVYHQEFTSIRSSQPPFLKPENLFWWSNFINSPPLYNGRIVRYAHFFVPKIITATIVVSCNYYSKNYSIKMIIIKWTFILKILVALYLNFSYQIIQPKGEQNIMGITELIVIGFLAILGFLAYNNSRKVSRELRRMGANK